MYSVFKKISTIVLSYLLITLCYSNILIQRLNLTQLTSQHTITYSSPFSQTPQFTFFIQSLKLDGAEMKIFHKINLINKKSITIEFEIQNNGFGFSTDHFVEIGLFFSDQNYVELGILETTSTNTVNLKYSKSHGNQYEIRFFCHSIPFIYELSSSNETNAKISLSSIPTTISGKTSIGFIVVEKAYISNKVMIIFEQFTSNSPDFLIELDSQGYLDPSSSNTALVLTGYQHSNSEISIQEYSNHEYAGQLIAIGYYLPNTTITLEAFVLSFNQDYTGCSNGAFLSYSFPFETVPITCGACDVSCQTCVSSPDDHCFTNENYCTTCGQLRYFSPLETNLKYGKCLCLKGLSMNSLGECIPCNYDCLAYFVEFIKAATTPEFILTFTHTNVIMEMQISQNLQIYVDQQLRKPLNLTRLRSGMYKIQMKPQHLKSCETLCIVQFLIVYPEMIYTKTKYLTKQFVSMEIHNYYTVNDRLPDQLNQAFLISSVLIGATAATGSASMIKMLFQVQQMIQFHKYLNLDIPVVFKEFIEALSVFKFLDFSSVMPYDVNSALRNLTDDDMDNKGPMKAVYYQNGANFYKNIIPATNTFILILFFNFLVFLILKCLPCQLLNKGSQKIRLRWLITLSDLMETLIVPVFLFGLFQASYVILSVKFFWIYMMMLMFTWTALIFPFLVTIYVHMSDKRGIVKKQIYEDLFQDVELSSKVSYVSYMFAFLRKFLFAMFLAPQLPGLMQVALLITLNMTHLFLMVYIILNKLFTSKLKVLTRIVNIISIIALEMVIMIYNMNYSQIDKMIQMGIVCTYLTIITTVTGVLQIMIKIGQIIIQKVHSDSEKTPQVLQTKNPIKCHLGKPLDFIFEVENQESQNQEKSNNQSSIVELGTNDILSTQKTKSISPRRPFQRPKPIKMGNSKKSVVSSKSASKSPTKSVRKDTKKLYPDEQEEEDNTIPSYQLYKRNPARKRKKIGRSFTHTGTSNLSDIVSLEK